MPILALLYPHRRLVTFAFHMVLVAAAYFTAFLLRFDFAIPAAELGRMASTLPILLVLRLVAFQRFGLFHDYWRHVGLREMVNLTRAATLGSAVFTLTLVALGQLPGVPRAVLVLDWLLAVFLVGGFRFAIRLLREAASRNGAPRARRTFVIGAGEAGEQILRQVLHDGRGRMRVVGLIDDDPDTHGRSLHGVQVLGSTGDLAALAARHRVEQLVIAIPSATPGQLRQVVDRCAQTGLECKCLPPLQDLLTGRAELAQLREVRIEDLLGREPVRLRLEPVQRDLAGKTILITGGAGSIGSELARQIARFGPRRIVLLDRAENTLWFVWEELRRTLPSVHTVPVIASITNARRLAQVFQAHRPDYVFHAAAYKHVSLCEANVIEAAWNNLIGTLRAAECAARYGSQKFVLISTDKAVNPTSILGATKRVAERMVLELPHITQSPTDFRAVRFGNVLGSDGSVLPLFRRQLAAGGPLTVTHPEVRRYFMTIPEAAQLVLQAAALPETAGRIAMLEMGEQVRILDLAEQLVRLSGLMPYRDIEIAFIGLRPGEKLHEELVGATEASRVTSVEKIRVVERNGTDPAAFRRSLRRLIWQIKRGDEQRVLRGIAELVPEYAPSAAVRAGAPTGDRRMEPMLHPTEPMLQPAEAPA